MYQDYTVGEHKANKGLRFLNYIIDVVLIIVLVVILMTIIYTIFNVLEIYISEESFIFDILMYAGYVFFYFLMETITKGRSLGKLITGTKVVMIDGSSPTTKDYFYRNLCRLIPFDALTFLGENGWHDKISKTTVVNKKAFEADLLGRDDIDSIGNTENEDNTIK